MHMVAAVHVRLAILCAAWLPLTLQQIVPATLGLNEFCHVSQEDLRVLPSAGFRRSVLQPFTTTTAGTERVAPVPVAANLSGCLFFNRTILHLMRSSAAIAPSTRSGPQGASHGLWKAPRISQVRAP